MADIKIDATGLRCPLPVLKMEAALRQMTPGQSLELTTDDPLAKLDIPFYASKNGHLIKALATEGPATTWLITYQPSQPPKLDDR